MLEGKGLLTSIQRDCLTLLATFPDQQHFYLTGGTALSEFFLGHRISFDLDFFTAEEPLIVPFSRHLESLCRQRGWEVDVVRRFASYVEFLLKKDEEELRLDLALDSPFRFEPPLLSEYGIWVNDFEDLKAEKVLAYYGRAEPRDAVDLHFILQRDSLDDLIALAAQKDPGFDLYWFAVALNRAEEFPDQVERWPVEMLVDLNPVELKRAFQQMAMHIMSQIQAKGSQ